MIIIASLLLLQAFPLLLAGNIQGKHNVDFLPVADLIWCKICICIAYRDREIMYFLFSGFDVSMSPKQESVTLKVGSPLFLSFMVCGSRESFETLSFKIKILDSSGAGAQLTPRLNSSLVRDSNAERYGISVTLLNAASPHHEMCNEVLVRVWTDQSNVQDSSIELLLNIKPDGERFPRTFRGGSYFLHLPIPTVPTPVVMTTTAATVPTPVVMTTTAATVPTPVVMTTTAATVPTPVVMTTTAATTTAATVPTPVVMTTTAATTTVATVPTPVVMTTTAATVPTPVVMTTTAATVPTPVVMTATAATVTTPVVTNTTTVTTALATQGSQGIPQTANLDYRIVIGAVLGSLLVVTLAIVVVLVVVMKRRMRTEIRRIRSGDRRISSGEMRRVRSGDRRISSGEVGRIRSEDRRIRSGDRRISSGVRSGDRRISSGVRSGDRRISSGVGRIRSEVGRIRSEVGSTRSR
jgi:hypothetical protein